MHEVNLNSIDLNLLPPLEALLRLKNVTYAAAEAGLSQPAMSRALSRLRLLLGDPLLVRGHQGYVLTPKAQSLVPGLTAATGQLRALLRPAKFDPKTEQRTIRMAASDAQTVLLVPPLMARLLREAPGINLVLEPYGPNIVPRMENGALDFAFALASTELPPGAVSIPLAKDRLVLVMRRNHPWASRRLTLKDYGNFNHAGVALLADGRSEIDKLLAAAGISRRITLVTPHFMASLAAVAATDMVTTVSLALARRFAAQFDLVMRKPPFAPVEMEMTLVWSHLRASDPVLVWFRALVRDVAGTVFAGHG